MKILFIDFDGVLDDSGYREYKLEKKKKDNDIFNPIAVAMLNMIFSKISDLKGIYSTTWKIGSTKDQLNCILEEHGFEFSNRMIGFTPSTPHQSHERMKQIEEWIKINNPDDFAIIDDITSRSHYPDTIQKNWFHCDNKGGGLTFRVACGIIYKFGGVVPKHGS